MPSWDEAILANYLNFSYYKDDMLLLKILLSAELEGTP